MKHLLALLSLVSLSAIAGIADTKHNLGASPGLAGRNQATDTAEICVFCHTPHGGDTTAPVPLWNKRLGSSGSYITYDTLQLPSLDGAVAPVGSISLACLSCHDGTQAMDNIINAPGSGGVTADGGGADGRAYGWTGATVGTTGRLTGGAALIGTDLSNDHPIGVQYCGGGLEAGSTCRDGDFQLPQSATINGITIHWVETGGAGKQRTDLPLYPRGTLGPLVECGSCHDPHVSANQPGPAGTGQSAGETFLRISNAGSRVCLTCHIK